MFFGGNAETSYKFLTELYRNLTFSMLLTHYSFPFDQLINISAEINILLRRLADDKTVKKEEQDLKMDDEIKTKFYLPEVETNNEDEITDDSLDVKPENVDEKLKQFELYAEPELETPEQINYYEKIKQEEKDEIEKIMDGAELGGKIEKTIEDILRRRKTMLMVKLRILLLTITRP